MKNILFISVSFFLIACSNGDKKKLEKMEIDPSYTELTPEKINHSMKQTMNVVDPFAQKLVDVQQVGDMALRKTAKRNKELKNSQREKSY